MVAQIATPRLPIDAILHGDSLEVLRSLPDACVDAIVTDPPAGVGFMGVAWDTYGERKGGSRSDKKWDYLGSQEHARTAPEKQRIIAKQGRAFRASMTAIFEECLRVLKPGGHALVWALPRTSHWTAMALEDAGFEVRDCCTHLFGSGFPKSLDVSKAIDKAAGRVGTSVASLKAQLRARFDASGLTLKQMNLACGFEASGYLRTSSTWAAVFPTREKWEVIKRALSCGDELDTLFDAAEREVIGQGYRIRRESTVQIAGPSDGEYDITAPATDAARTWDGWGTALKPAAEFWWLCRKPLAEGTVAANVLTWGTGALNIDGSRIPGAKGDGVWGTSNATINTDRTFNASPTMREYRSEQHPAGRWPANLVLSHSLWCDETACALDCPVRALDAQSGITRNGGQKYPGGKQHSMFGNTQVTTPTNWAGDAGGASRYFTTFRYTAKASRSERNRGCSSLDVKAVHRYGAGLGQGQHPEAPVIERNSHPTVKPLALMSWLIGLITPPGGLVLDPFAGSGSTLVAARDGGWRYLGIEREREYVAIAEARLEAALSTSTAVKKPAPKRTRSKKQPQPTLLEVSA